MSLLRGLFDGDADDLFRAFASSLELDLWIAEEDIECSIAHVTMLGETGVVTADEAKTLIDGLSQILEEYRTGAWAPDESQEDIHLAVEARLTALVGEVGGKLHTARSRNDQVATDVRLWLKRRLGAFEAAVRDLVTTLLDRVESDGQVLMPGYTHLQRGQPILLGHHLLAHAWALSRDIERIQGVIARMDRCPLGAGALAGTPHSIDRHQTAEHLGFSGPVENAMDAVASKDHLQETVSACAICMSTLSRMAEELVLWSSQEFAFMQMSDAFTTGSSIMPQKKNPDMPELVRGKTGRVVGSLMNLLVMLKGLPLTYNRDLQEDKAPVFEAFDTVRDCLAVLAGAIASARFDKEAMATALQAGVLDATEVADWLATRDVPFRDAHHVAGRLVQLASQQGKTLAELPLETYRAEHEAFDDSIYRALDMETAVERRDVLGGPARGRVAAAVAELRGRLRARRNA